MNYPDTDKTNREDAMFLAQQIAFAPVVFQLARALKNFRVLETLSKYPEGLTIAELHEHIDLSEYSLSLLLDGGESSGLLKLVEDRYTITLVGRYIEDDRRTSVNMNFINDVCYKGLFHLDSALRENRPAGLEVFGQWKTIYEHLTKLPAPILNSWLEFDHFYSDGVFQKILPVLFRDSPGWILDVGGNTGKFAVAAARHNPEVRITILDHAEQLKLANERIKENGFSDRVNGLPMDLLDHDLKFPQGVDIVWMSQFLDCFSKHDILNLMKRSYDAVTDDGYYFIMETFIDRQRHPIARFCLDMISFYFTCMANGQSRMYRAADFYKLLDEANFEIVEEFNNIGISHTLLKCRKKR